METKIYMYKVEGQQVRWSRFRNFGDAVSHVVDLQDQYGVKSAVITEEDGREWAVEQIIVKGELKLNIYNLK